MEEQGSQSTDNIVQKESDQGDASFSSECLRFAMNKSKSHQTKVT